MRIRTILLLNGLFSLLNALMFLFFEGFVSWMGIDKLEARIFGVALLLFAALVFWIYSNPQKIKVKILSIMDFSWVLGIPVAIIAQAVPLSQAGVIYMLATCVPVAFFGWRQWGFSN
jgi:hypothetical protein